MRNMIENIVNFGFVYEFNLVIGLGFWVVTT